MSTPPPSHPPPVDMSNNLDLNGNEAASATESKREVVAPFEAMLRGLAGKVQGKEQTVRQFAGEVEATVLKIFNQFPQEMSEQRVAQVKRVQFYKGLKRTYRETFVHLYEEGMSFEKLVDAVIVVEEALR